MVPVGDTDRRGVPWQCPPLSSNTPFSGTNVTLVSKTCLLGRLKKQSYGDRANGHFFTSSFNLVTWV